MKGIRSPKAEARRHAAKSIASGSFAELFFRMEFQPRKLNRRLNKLMKSPMPESSFKFIEAVGALLRCEELQRDDVSESTHELIEAVLESAGQVRRECEFPDRSEIIEFFAKRFAEEDREMLVKRVVALVGTLSNEELYSSFEEAREMGRSGGKDET